MYDYLAKIILLGPSGAGKYDLLPLSSMHHTTHYLWPNVLIPIIVDLP